MTATPMNVPAQKKRRMSSRQRPRVNRVAQLLGFLLAIFIIAPYIVMFFVSIMPRTEVFTPPLHVIPRAIDFSNFTIPWTDFPLPIYFRNSLIIAFGATVLGLLIAIPAAYVLARFRFRFRTAITLTLLMTQMLSPAMLILGVYQEFRQFGLLNNLVAVIVVNTAFTVAFAVLILSDVFESIPFEIEEAAFIDGASRFQTFRKISLPLAAPGIVTTAIFTFIAAWNEYVVAYTLASSPEKQPFSVGLSLLTGLYEVKWNFLFAGSLIAIIPIIILFISIEKYLVGGLTAGSVK